MSTTAFIGLGSNIGDGLKTLRLAWQALGEHEAIELQALSSPYLSAPVGMTSSNWFTNGVGCLAAELSAMELLRAVLAIETDFGRRRDSSVPDYQDRTLDLDILYFDQLVMREEDLILPHPLIGERLFVLEPLAEIGGNFRDPVDGCTAIEKLAVLHQAMQDNALPVQELRRVRWP